MTHPASRLRLPDEIKPQTLSFLDWYAREVFHDAKGPTHIENSVWALDWQPQVDGNSRLTVTDRSTGVSAANEFRFDHLAAGEAAGHEQPPPTSLLMTTWFDLCYVLGQLGDGRRAELDERLQESTEYDQHRLGTALYG